jgi:hypothetical protein
MSARLAFAALLLAAPLAAQQTPRPAPRQGQQPPAESAAADTSLRIEYRREVYSYQGGPRDPFASLIATSDVRQDISDLRLVSVAYDARGGNSVAVVREVGSNAIHRLRRGQSVGRLRVIQIRQYEVVFQVEEFGFERQEVLTLSRPEGSR